MSIEKAVSVMCCRFCRAVAPDRTANFKHLKDDCREESTFVMWPQEAELVGGCPTFAARRRLAEELAVTVQRENDEEWIQQVMAVMQYQ